MLALQERLLPPSHTIRALTGTREPTRTYQVLKSAQNVLQGPALRKEPPDALRVPEERTQTIGRMDLATPAIWEPMRKRKGQLNAVDAQPKPVLRTEVIGATHVRPEVALLDLVTNRPANFVLKGIILH